MAEAKKKPAAKPVKKAETAVAAPQADKVRHRHAMVGTVMSNKMTKTIIVKVDRQVRHGLYAKYVGKTKRYKAHDEKNDAKVGDLVSVVQSKPISRDKRWVLREIIRRAEA